MTLRTAAAVATALLPGDWYTAMSAAGWPFKRPMTL
jgi:hypothetical protein